MDGGSVANTVTLDTSKASFFPTLIGQGETVVVTHDSGSGSETPVVHLSDFFVDAFTVDATNGAEAILNSFSGDTTATLNADGGTIDASCGLGFGDKVEGTISGGGSLIVGAGLTTSDKVDIAFTGPGQLQLASGTDLFDCLDVTSFQKGDTIVVDDLRAAPGSSYCWDGGWTSFTDTVKSTSGGMTDQTLTFFNGSHEIGSLTINGIAQGNTLTVTGGDDPGSSKIECVCFLAGTHIATAGGERLVERLRAGDLVRTHAGAIARVKWVGHRTIDTTTLRSPELSMPVRVTAGAIAEGVPQRDLRVTPEHALLVGGKLIPARLLVNGTTVRLDQVDSYSFYHVELDRHDILLAEGMGAESYLDTGNRGLFANNGVVDLFAAPAETTAEAYNALACMQLTLDPAATWAVWQTIAARAATLGHAATLPAVTRDADLGVCAGSRRLRPVFATSGQVAFALPAGAHTVTIASRASMPWAVQPWLDDRRQLGVAIERIVLRSADDVQEVALDSPAVGACWWAAETAGARRFRWTDGAAQITLPASSGPATLEVSLHATALHAIAGAAANMPAPQPVALAG